MYAVASTTLLLLPSLSAHAALIDVFKDEQGRTKWQHVANFSGSVLIILLTLSLIGLAISQYRIRLRNRQLRQIRRGLESEVQKRTERLHESNQLLQESNRALEEEISEHKETAAELIKSQAYLKSILASMPSMLIGLNDKLEITHWNKTAQTITGHGEDKVIGSYLWDAYPTITLAPEQVRQVLESGQPQQIKHSQRGQYYFDITVFPLEGQSGVVVVVENVTQRSLAENMLIQRDKMASMGELAATMAYDINSPLQGILSDIAKAQTKLLSQGGNAEEVSRLLKDAIEQGSQASAVVKNLLDFADNNAAEKQAAQIPQLLDHCLELAEDVISNPKGLHFRDIAITRQYAEPGPELECYVAELQQVFLSLLRHAAHALNARYGEADFTPQITIEVFDAYESLWVKVQHNGRGLTPEQQQDIFEPIVQQTTPTNPKPLPVENRLSFSYFIVTEHHDGEMAVTSDIDIGTTFHIQFHRHY